MENNNNIVIIDNHKYFHDIEADCLIPIDSDDSDNLNDLNGLNDFDYSYSNKTESNKKQSINKSPTNLSNLENTDIPNEWYMEHYSIDFWENILSRSLNSSEKKMFHNIWNENSLNLDIKVLEKNLIKHNSYIKNITGNVGNCLFESLGSLGLGSNDLNISPHKMIRKSLATVLLMVKTEVGFFPKIDLTPEEIFNNINEIEFVKDKKTSQVYVYDYDTMIYDLSTSYSWERLPTEFILMAVSRIYQVEIRIYHNTTDFANIINVLEDGVEPENIIRLGQINEEHYFPLEKIPEYLTNNSDIIDYLTDKKIVYNESSIEFKKWSKTIMDSIGSSNNYNNENIENKKIIQDNPIPIIPCISNPIIMKTNKLNMEQEEDYKQISNFEDFHML